MGTTSGSGVSSRESASKWGVRQSWDNTRFSSKPPTLGTTKVFLTDRASTLPDHTLPRQSGGSVREQLEVFRVILPLLARALRNRILYLQPAVMDKKALSERDICTKFVTPALQSAGWDIHSQIREEVSFTKGRVIVRGRLATRGEPKRADYILYHKPNIPIALIEAKDNNHIVGAGMQQALGYAETLDLPFVFSTNGDGFLEHDRTKTSGALERELDLTGFPSPAELWQRYCEWKGITESERPIIEQDFYFDGSGKQPRYYQLIAINRTIEAIAKGQNRALLVMATGTGKTATAFHIIWRLWKAGVKKRILFLADRNILVDQARTNDFKAFGAAMTKIKDRTADKSYEIYLALYQAVSGTEEEKNIYKQFSPDFFDLVVIDECHLKSHGSIRKNDCLL